MVDSHDDTESRSLLTQALQGPQTIHSPPSAAASGDRLRESNGGYDNEVTPQSRRNILSYDEYDDGLHSIPQHSDFTLPTSNTKITSSLGISSQGSSAQSADSFLLGSPPSTLTPIRRPVMGPKVESRYAHTHQQLPSVKPDDSPPTLYYTFDGHIRHTNNDDDDDDELLASPTRKNKRTISNLSESIHAQSLLMGIAFMAVWTPNNAMAPNLTAMANDFEMTHEYERDLYLGSYISLALGVFCLPISALLGFMADFYSRKYLFVACILGGSLSTLWTANAQTFASLFWSRLSCGGCMSASVPVAFSLMGDLFGVEERNAASSGLTAMMGLGMVVGQVYAGTIGPNVGWPHVFVMSSLLQAITALFVFVWVREPTRGGKEKALQDLLESGKQYDRQLTFSGFIHAMHQNRSNSILLWQGFFTSLPWGIIFCFLNDFLSQEKGFSVPDATVLVMIFGIGCAIGGIAGGYIGQLCLRRDRKWLPYFMAITTALGIVPFVALLETDFDRDTPYSKKSGVGWLAMTYSLLGGIIASLPGVNVRPCIINVNPPETRGAALTASNLLITLGRGIGPSCITLMGSIFKLSRQTAFNWTLTIFWLITAIQLLFLAQTFPQDQDDMEAELERYAATQTPLVDSPSTASIESRQDDDGDTDNVEEPPLPRPAPVHRARSSSSEHSRNLLLLPSAYMDGFEDPVERVSFEEYVTSINNFDGLAARQSLQFVSQGIRELREELSHLGCGTPADAGVSSSDDDDGDNEFDMQSLPTREATRPKTFPRDKKQMNLEEMRRRKQAWKRRQKKQQEGANETTPLL
eukprot:scaffold1624_cov105-Cylindrotheca_fusiformis.AAC.8